MTETMREAIARKLAEVLWSGATFDNSQPHEREAFLKAADAAIALQSSPQTEDEPDCYTEEANDIRESEARKAFIRQALKKADVGTWGTLRDGEPTPNAIALINAVLSLATPPALSSPHQGED